VIDFQGDAESNFAKLRAVKPTGPLMCGEWYSSWFDGWGRKSRRSDNTNHLTR